MKKLILLTSLLVAFCFLSASAISLNPSRLELEIQLAKMSMDEHVAAFLNSSQQDDEFNTDSKDKSIYEYDYKSPKRAFLYSLIIPGWGQKYAGSTIIKPIFFLGVEAASWVFYFQNHGKGLDKTDEFEKWADKYWIEGDSAGKPDESYRGWLLDTLSIAVDTGMGHHLPDSKTQQYYEMIGKYEQFRAGWDDYWADTVTYDNVPSPHREQYNNLRGEANDFLNKANMFMIVSLANHLLSAFDAALAARRHNKSQAGDSWMTVKAELKKYSATEEIPILKFSFRF
jgi:hypothetical protein